MTPETVAAWDALHRPTRPEGIEISDAFDRIDAADALPEVPAVVLSADKPLPPTLIPPEIPDFTAIWGHAQALGAAYLHAPQVTETDSGHVMSAYSPELVVDAIRDIVDADRTAGSRTTGP